MRQNGEFTNTKSITDGINNFSNLTIRKYDIMKHPKIKGAAIGLSLFVVSALLVFLQHLNNRQKASIHVRNPKLSPMLANSSKAILPDLANLGSNIELHRREREKEIKKHLEEQRAEEDENQRMKRWKRNFPYKPTYHPTLTHDPSRYDANDHSTFRGDPEMEMAVKNHSYLVAFYNNPQIYSAEFEQLYHMLQSIDRADLPIITGKIFNLLIHYHKSCQHDPTAPLAGVKTALNAADPNEHAPQKELRLQHKMQTTWVERAERYRNGIVGLLALDKYWPDKERMTADTARAFRDRIINEIPPENLIKMHDVIELPNGQIGTFGYDGQTMRNLKHGDPLLYR